MEPGAVTRTGRQAQDRSGGEAEERSGTDRYAFDRILTSAEGQRVGFAPAKINLYLHVGPPASDGYHPVCTLLTFADIGDVMRLDEASDNELIIEGPFAEGLEGGADNLVNRARSAALTWAAVRGTAFGFHLTKNLPLASGIGGGSADAAAALRLSARHLGIDPTGPVVVNAASSLGSDVPACLASGPALATGRGDRLAAAPSFPSLHAVLVNPNVASPTARAYRGYDSAPSPQGADRRWPAADLHSVRDTALFLAECRNDLEAPVIRSTPPVGDVLALLRRQPETLLARMSGSGATCFSLVENARDARLLEERISSQVPGWWVRRTVLAGEP
ncbi:MAG TPA: 4-(cytidine 5'-diphospho)-2-C-methyl-D-erythritol kinase [Caulobacteraceae bacterium]|jgi:4-diphosphocytidyl-2-C-methyl-D-erythritol kinase